MNITLTFPHPPRVLSPNGRVPLTKASAVKLNFAKVAAKKRVRDSAYMNALAAIRAHEAAIGAKLARPRRYRIEWYYAGTKPDADNCIARCKPILDGVAHAFGIDDRDLIPCGVERERTKDSKLRHVVRITFADGALPPFTPATSSHD